MVPAFAAGWIGFSGVNRDPPPQAAAFFVRGSGMEGQDVNLEMPCASHKKKGQKKAPGGPTNHRALPVNRMWY